MQKETKDILEHRVRDVGFSELLIAMGLVFILGVISTATSVMTTLQVKRQALKLDKQEAFYTGELAAWHFYYKNDGSSQPCSNTAGFGDKCIVSITNETIANQNAEDQDAANQDAANQNAANQDAAAQNAANQNVYHPESYQPGMPLALAITSLFDSKNTILRRYTGDNVKIKDLARADIVSFCGEMSFATRTRTFSICLVSPPEGPPYPPPPIGGQTGKMTIDISPGANIDTAYAVALQSDGKIVVAGSSIPTYSVCPLFGGVPGDNHNKFNFYPCASGSSFALARFLSNGSLDVTFGKEGRVLTGFGDSATLHEARAIAIQSDEKIVVGGIVTTRTSAGAQAIAFGLARYQSNGALDTTFGGSGRVVTIHEDGVSVGSRLHALKILGNGKIIAAGTTANFRNFALAKYNSNGTLDTFFGSGGTVLYQMNSIGESAAHATIAYGLDIQSDEKIVVAGHCIEQNQKLFAVARFSSTGSVDASFGAGTGSVRTQFLRGDGTTRIPSEAYAVVIQPDGKIVLAGTGDSFVPSAGGVDVDLARYNTDGTLDTTFGNAGLVITDFADGGTEAARAVAIRSDGKIIIGGYWFAPTGGTLVAIYSSDGGLEQIFPLPIEALGWANPALYAMAIQPDGAIVGAGTRATGATENNNFGIVRYVYPVAVASWVIDPGFGSSGVTSIDLLFNDDYALTTAIQPDGKILVGGTTSEPPSSPVVGLARLNPDGSLDTSFGSGGTVSTNISEVSYGDSISGIALQSDGKIVVAGNTGAEGTLARYDSNGNLDLSFGTGNGFVVSSPGSIFSLAIQSDDKIVAAGAYGYSVLARFNANGSPDGSFGAGGRVENGTYQTHTLKQVNSVVIQPDGKILATGFLAVEGLAGHYDFVVARYLPNGSFDTGFGEMGVVHTDFSTRFSSLSPPPTYTHDLAYSSALQSDGKIVVAGGAQAYGVHHGIALARYTTNGNLDATFGSGGRVVTMMPDPTRPQQIHSVAVQNDGRIIVSGYVSAMGLSGAYYDMFFARYYSSGRRDRGFGNNGFVILPFGRKNPPHVGPNMDVVYSSAMYYATAVEPGRIVAVGSTSKGSHTDFAILRLNWLGGLDTTFGLPPGTPNND